MSETCMYCDEWRHDCHVLMGEKETLVAERETLQQRFDEADAARRHAQAVGSELVQEKRDLQAQLAAAQEELASYKAGIDGEYGDRVRAEGGLEWRRLSR